jgi:hypothetical protein
MHTRGGSLRVSFLQSSRLKNLVTMADKKLAFVVLGPPALLKSDSNSHASFSTLFLARTYMYTCVVRSAIREPALPINLCAQPSNFRKKCEPGSNKNRIGRQISARQSDPARLHSSRHHGWAICVVGDANSDAKINPIAWRAAAGPLTSKVLFWTPSPNERLPPYPGLLIPPSPAPERYDLSHHLHVVVRPRSAHAARC